jgi:enamine deaminase RidA (YjgF/YER057c/UK114 family)
MFSFSQSQALWSRAVSSDAVISLLSPKSMHEPRGYSHAAKVRSCTLLFIAGQVALDASGKLVGPDDFRAQAQQTFENLKAAVEAADGNFRNIVKLNVYVVDVSKLPDYREVRDRYIDVNHPPVSTAIQVASLFRPEFLIEVEAVAALT